MVITGEVSFHVYLVYIIHQIDKVVGTVSLEVRVLTPLQSIARIVYGLTKATRGVLGGGGRWW